MSSTLFTIPHFSEYSNINNKNSDKDFDNISMDLSAGLEFGLKYYVLEGTFILGRAEYQFFFDDGDEAEDNFDDGAFAYVIGIGYHF